MEEQFAKTFRSEKVQSLYKEFTTDIISRLGVIVHSDIPAISEDTSVLNQVSVLTHVPLDTIALTTSNRFKCVCLEDASIVTSNEAVELYVRYKQSLDLSELPWLPLQAIGPGLVMCHFLPNVPLDSSIPEDMVSKVILSPKNYFAVAEELLDRDLQDVVNILEVKEEPMLLSALNDITKSTPKSMAVALCKLFLPTSNIHKELTSAVDALPDEVVDLSELESYLDSTLPLVVSEWFSWRFRVSHLPVNALSPLLVPDFIGFLRPVDVIDPRTVFLDKLNQSLLSKIWSLGFGIVSNKDKVLTLCRGINVLDGDKTVSDLRRICNQFQVRFVYCSEVDLQAYISFQRDSYSAVSARTNLVSAAPLGSSAQTNVLQLNADELSENNIADFVNTILSLAIENNASDIHIEPVADTCVIRFRVDGVLRRHIDAVPDGYLPLIVNRIKNIATNMDITINNAPQDGRARVSCNGNNIDLRIATIPIEADNLGREKCVIRILDNSKAPDKIDSIFWDPFQRTHIRNAIHAPYGCIIVTGPTGSGKSTTLYTLLGEVNSPEKNIMTVEDPVERKLLGVQQVAVSPSLSFSDALRSFLRMDPDIILIGEIRDEETAKLTVRAAQTGHLCLTTLHTNTALGAIERLSHLGVKGHDIASSLLMVTGQRLLRTLCPNCKRRVKLNSAQLELFKQYNITSENIANGYYYTTRTRGCRSCHNTGYSSRIAITETIPIDEELRGEILSGANHKRLAELAISKNLHTMYHYGLVAVSRGLTDFVELHKLVEGF